MTGAATLADCGDRIRALRLDGWSDAGIARAVDGERELVRALADGCAGSARASVVDAVMALPVAGVCVELVARAREQKVDV